jgi:sensor histidine kinase regulating citrate/malate metabolism
VSCLSTPCCLFRQFLDELGGEVQVKGAVRQGTTFELLIPFKNSLVKP